MKKTVREWLEELPEPYRTQAIENTRQDILETSSPDIIDAIKTSFFWAKTAQGHAYWNKVCNRLR